MLLFFISQIENKFGHVKLNLDMKINYGILMISGPRQLYSGLVFSRSLPKLAGTAGQSIR
jgi:hypothetical protein